MVILNKEHLAALQVHDTGFTLSTLHYDQEVRKAKTYFAEIKNGSVDKNQLALAEQLVNSLSAPFAPEKFADHYQESLIEMVKAKAEGSEPQIAQKVERGKVINLMDALKQSIAKSRTEKKPSARSIRTTGRKRKQKRLA